MRRTRRVKRPANLESLEHSSAAAGPNDETLRPPPRIGASEWFRPGEHQRVERVLSDLRALHIGDLRTGISWADWCSDGGEAWYNWLLPRLATEVRVLPCFVCTPPSLAVVPRESAPPRDPKWYADFIDQMITLFGNAFEWVELWSGPNNLRKWDVELDPDWMIFSRMVGGAAYWAKHRGKKTVLGSTRPTDPHWVRLMCERNVMEYIDAVGIHGFPATFEPWWEGWTASTARVREVLDREGSKAEVWITGTGYSTWRHDERGQLAAFVDAIEAPAERVYWYSLHDLAHAAGADSGGTQDEREFHFGMMRADGSAKLLYRLWASTGLEAVRDAAQLTAAVCAPRQRQATLITGGAGFIGCNLAHRLLSERQPVIILDNLARPGVEQNLQWLRSKHGNLLQVEIADIRDERAISRVLADVFQVFHLAAQVAVTASLSDPISDFGVNARGTLNLLEALRNLNDPPPLIFTSTNKVYGALDDVPLIERSSRYELADLGLLEHGVPETRPLNFHSPYGCSKGAADQYIADYAHTFSFPTIVFRMSCIYGPHQFGTEDQGWVAHFLIRALCGEPITIYGDGKQVRDILYVDDLIDAFLAARQNIEKLSGEVFNIGGGPANSISLLELMELIGELHGTVPSFTMDPWRRADQRCYVSDYRKFQQATGWAPRVNVRDGVARLYEWLTQNMSPRPRAALAETAI